MFVLLPQASAQIAVTGSTGANGTYGTLKLAFDAINANTNQGGNNIAITITASTTETATASLNQLATPWTSLIIYPNGTGFSISGSLASSIIELNGADNVTIDGRINGAGSSVDLVIKNTNTSSGSSGILFKNDANNNILNYCKIFCYNSNTGVTDGSLIFSTTTGSTGNDGNTISNNEIGTDDNTKLTGNAIMSNGTATKLNSGNSVTNNKFYDFKTYGLNLTTNTDSWTITGNSFYQTVAFAPSANVYMIYFNSGGGYTITGNYFGGQASACGGSPFTLNSSAFTLSVVTSGSSSSGGTITISGNAIKNISVTSTNSTAGQSAFSGFNLFGSCDYIIGTAGNGNQFGETSGAAPSISVAANNTTVTPFLGIYTSTNITTQNVSIAYNTFGAISISSSSTPALSRFISTAATANYYNSVTIDHNIIGNSTTDNIVYSIKNTFYGINAQATISPLTCSITNNIIQGVNFNAVANDNNSGYLIYFNSTTGKSCTVSGNTIDNITLATAGSSANTYWRFIKSSTGNGDLTVNSNTISNINQSVTTKCWVSFIEIDNSGSVTCNSNVIGAAAPSNNLTLASANYHYGIYFGYQGTFNINSNTIQQINQTSSSSSASFQPIVVYYLTSSTASLPSCSLNVVTDITCAGTNTSDPFYGIYFSGTTANIDNNTIQNITTSTGFNGIATTAGSETTLSVTNNNITNITQTGAATFNGIKVGTATTSITITGNTINDIDFTSTSTTTVLSTAITVSGAAAITVGTAANPNIIGSTTGVASATDGITITNNAASNGNISIIKVTGTSGAVSVAYNSIGGIKISGTNTSGKLCLVENLSTVSSTIDNNTFGNATANNIDFIADMQEEWITNNGASGTITMTVSNNIFQNIKISTTAAKRIAGVQNDFNSGGASATGTLTCTGNTFSNISSTATSAFYLITVGSLSTYHKGPNQNISNNNISNISITSSTSIYFIYIDIKVGPATVSSNTIGNSSSNNIAINANSSVYGIYNTTGTTSGTGIITIDGNTIQQFNLTNTGAGNKFYGIYYNLPTSNAQTCSISNNHIRYISSLSTYASTTLPTVSGIYFKSDNSTTRIENLLNDNWISGLYLNSTAAINNSIAGYYCGDIYSGYSFKKNHIYDITNKSTGGGGFIYGIYDLRAVAAAYSGLFENDAVVLDNSPNTNSINLYGMYVNYNAGSSVNGPEVYHTTIKVAGSSGGTTKGVAGFLKPVNSAGAVMTNNIFQNLRTGGSGGNYAIYNDKATPYGTYDYNYLEVAENANKLIYWGAADKTFVQWQAIPKGANDLNSSVNLDQYGAPPSPALTDVLLNGINTLGITIDIDGVTRNNGAVTIPCGSCSGPWRGAYESSTPLPIELTKFEGACNNNQVVLMWQTASEKNNNFFSIERSIDGKNFITIGSVKGAGNSSQTINYSFVDEESIESIKYYRLSQEDYDGTITHSNLIAVEHYCSINDGSEISVYPNPSASSFILETKLYNDSKVAIEMYNSMGGMVKNIPGQMYPVGLQTINLDGNDLKPGLYYLKIIINKKEYFHKVIKL